MNTPQSTEVVPPFDLAEHCEKAARFYAEKPGLFQAGTVVDIYECLTVLARDVKRLREALAALQKTQGE